MGKFAAINSSLLLSSVDSILMMLRARSITDLPSIIYALPAKQKLLRHRRRKCPSSPAVDPRRSQTRVIPRANPERRNQARIPDPARPPSLERCVASPIRRQRVVDSARRVQVDLRRSDDAALIVPCPLLIVRSGKAIGSFFTFRCSSLKTSRSVPCLLTRKPFRHSPLPTPYIKTLLSPSHGSFHLHWNQSNLAQSSTSIACHHTRKL
jgi:hypothetical protein